MKIEIDITEQDIKDIKEVRNYFGEHDETMFEHKAYAIMDILLKKSTKFTAIKSLPEYNEILYHAKILTDEQFREYWDEIQCNVLR